MNPGNLFKSLLLVAGLLAGSGAAFARTGEDTATAPGENSSLHAARFALSVNGGLCFPYTDVKPAKTTVIFGIGATYFATSYLHINLDLQKGWLKSGEAGSSLLPDPSSDNSFFAASLTARFLPLALIQNKNPADALPPVFSGLYGGIGLGFIANDVKAGSNPPPDYGSLGTYSGLSFMLPIEAGINIPVLLMRHQRRLWINLNYRVHLCFSDKIDGYVPVVAANKKNDAYNTLTAGLVYNF